MSDIIRVLLSKVVGILADFLYDCVNNGMSISLIHDNIIERLLSIHQHQCFITNYVTRAQRSDETFESYFKKVHESGLALLLSQLSVHRLV